MACPNPTQTSTLTSLKTGLPVCVGTRRGYDIQPNNGVSYKAQNGQARQRSTARGEGGRATFRAKTLRRKKDLPQSDIFPANSGAPLPLSLPPSLPGSSLARSLARSRSRFPFRRPFLSAVERLVNDCSRGRNSRLCCGERYLLGLPPPAPPPVLLPFLLTQCDPITDQIISPPPAAAAAPAAVARHLSRQGSTGAIFHRASDRWSERKNVGAEIAVAVNAHSLTSVGTSTPLQAQRHLGPGGRVGGRTDGRTDNSEH